MQGISLETFPACGWPARPDTLLHSVIVPMYSEKRLACQYIVYGLFRSMSMSALRVSGGVQNYPGPDVDKFARLWYTYRGLVEALSHQVHIYTSARESAGPAGRRRGMASAPAKLSGKRIALGRTLESWRHAAWPPHRRGNPSFLCRIPPLGKSLRSRDRVGYRCRFPVPTFCLERPRGFAGTSCRFSHNTRRFPTISHKEGSDVQEALYPWPNPRA